MQANNYSPETTYKYERDLQVFDHFITESNIGFDKVNKRTITYYKAYLGSRDRKTANLSHHGEKQLDSRTINRVLSALRAYLRYLIELNRSQIDDSGRIFITGKGRKQRFVYLTPRATHYLSIYLSTRHDNCPALFIPYAGRKVLIQQLYKFSLVTNLWIPLPAMSVRRIDMPRKPITNTIHWLRLTDESTRESIMSTTSAL